MPPRIVIIGAGPTGLGAGIRLRELGHKEWIVYESKNKPGGLAGSVTDAHGFTWDFGGHVFFTSFDRVRNLLASFPKDFFICHKRKAFIRLDDFLVPYPFQLNLDVLPNRLSPKGEHDLAFVEQQNSPENFRDWLGYTFGKDQCTLFFYPYNEKIWGIPLSKMSYTWVENRITTPGHENQKDSWGPNNTFLYPRSGGMGALFEHLASRICDHILYGHEIVGIDIENKTVRIKGGKVDNFDMLISTMPLTSLVDLIGNDRIPQMIVDEAMKLCWNSCLVSGLGVSGSKGGNFSWIYFPEPCYPFYRVTALSEYSESLVPTVGRDRYYSLMCETTIQSQGKPSIAQLLDGMIKADLLREGDSKKLKVCTQIELPYAYPVPTLDRDKALATIQGFFESRNIFSRGRFGGWKYEVGNMDHSLMQGMEIIDRILLGMEEKVYRV